jgi:penicillin V acylase-like amidase (Ntn superfamily)
VTKLSLPIVSLILAATIANATFACTVFHAADGDVVLGGNNEDWHVPLTKLWFLPEQEGRYGVVYVTFSDHRAIQGGMNDQGLFFDFLAVKRRDVAPTPDKPPWNAHPLREVMERCATVDEAVEMLEAHNRAFMWRICIFLGDARGDSAIVEAEAVVRKQGTFQVATNFRQSLIPPAESTCRRHRTATRMLSQADAVNVDLFRRICAAVHQRGKNPTLYSTIYDLKRKVVYLYHYHNFENVVTLDLAEELAKGEHVVEMPGLFPKNPAFEQYRQAIEQQKRSRPVPSEGSQSDKPAPTPR